MRLSTFVSVLAWLSAIAMVWLMTLGAIERGGWSGAGYLIFFISLALLSALVRSINIDAERKQGGKQ